MINNKINKGCLWLGEEWKTAIDKTFLSKDVTIKELWVYENPNLLLDDKKVFVCFYFSCYDNHKQYKTRIPKRFNNYIYELKGGIIK